MTRPNFFKRIERYTDAPSILMIALACVLIGLAVLSNWWLS